jgi:hypothetical protein
MFIAASRKAPETPAAQGYVEGTHGLFYAGFWASNVDFGKERNRAGNLQDVAHLELGPYAGIRPP